MCEILQQCATSSSFRPGSGRIWPVYLFIKSTNAFSYNVLHLHFLTYISTDLWGKNRSYKVVVVYFVKMVMQRSPDCQEKVTTHE